jgi:hypothetical protein
MPKGDLHVTVTLAMGVSDSGKKRFRVEHLCFQCLAKWLIGEYVRWTTRKKKPAGRPKGRTGFPQLSDEQREERRRLVVARGRLIRGITRSYDMVKVRADFHRLTELSLEITKLGGPIQSNLMSRRSEEDRKAFLAKLSAAGIIYG